MLRGVLILCGPPLCVGYYFTWVADVAWDATLDGAYEQMPSSNSVSLFINAVECLLKVCCLLLVSRICAR